MKYSNGESGKYAWAVKIGEKGQFVIPKEARALFGINPGDTIILLAHKDRCITIPKKEEFSEFMSKIFKEGVKGQNERT
ncbi:MAG: AbrB/MazE/SpoVT family DNA-binding domain-containing protein [Clostridiales bacterium]|nr:AbrB/MazE/SpoVT family DNA-binding domain-containing protein [Clostridiales bacterium]